MATLIIGPDYIKKNSPLEYSLDEGYVTPLIIDAQEMTLQELLGSSMYDDILSEMATEAGGGAAISTKYSNILDYLKNIVLWDTMQRLVLESTFKMTNQGAVTKSDGINAALTQREIAQLRGRFRSKADHWRWRLWRYLCEYSSTYPLWNSPPSDCLVYPKRPHFRTAMT